MKTIRLLFLFLAVSAVALYSCSDSDPIETNHSNIRESIALRTALNEIKKANNLTGRTAANPFCFSFVYPITLSLNNDGIVTINSLEGLIDLLQNETSGVHVEGIAFPFQVTMEGQVQTIDDEEEFIALLINCGFSTWNDDLETTTCFDIVFPVSVTSPNGTFEINSVGEFNNYINAPANGEVQIVYPVSVLYQGQVIVVNNIYEFYDIINNCDDCSCTLEYDPVCVNTPNGTIEFGNLCHALCSGYTQNDIVDCNPSNTCDITNLTVTVGDCNTDGTYAITIDFDYANAGATQFNVYTNASFMVGTYNLADLPVTVSHYPHSGQGADFMTVMIANGTNNCTAVQQWATPACNTGPCSVCTADWAPVCVQTATGIQQFTNACWAICNGYTQADFVECGVAPVDFGTALGSCFQLSFPVQIMAGGEVITANDNGTVLQYWNPAQSSIPNFVYPVTVSAANGVVVVNNQAEFQNIVNSCN